MKRSLSSSMALALMVLLIQGCVDPISQMVNANIDLANIKSDSKLSGRKQEIVSKFRTEHDTDAWLEQRQNMAQAMGDKIFEKDYSRVFDSLVLAVSTLELKVSNMERSSGYIAASGIALPPSEAKALKKEAFIDWCKQKGYDPSVMDIPFKSDAMKSLNSVYDQQIYGYGFEKMQKGLTFQLIKMGENQTKVKLRFSDVYYPPEIESYYKIVWQAVDKQIFVDQNIEGKVEKKE